MQKIKIARDEFRRVRSLIRQDGVKILYYKNKDEFVGSSRSRAYTYSLEDPPLIVIRKGRGITYREVIGNLLHEYAHVLDDRRYGDSERSRLYTEISLENIPEEIIAYPRKAKYALLKTELIVENMVPKLWRRFEIRLPFDEDYWACEKAITLRVYKHWVLRGVPPAKKTRDQWKKDWKTKQWDADEAYITDLSGV